MHKKLASDLTSLAHSILQMKNKEDVFELKQKAHEVYEKLSVLAYVEEYINKTPNPSKTKEELLKDVFLAQENKTRSEIEKTDFKIPLLKQDTVIYQLEEELEEEPEGKVIEKQKEELKNVVDNKIEGEFVEKVSTDFIKQKLEVTEGVLKNRTAKISEEKIKEKTEEYIEQYTEEQSSFKEIEEIIEQPFDEIENFLSSIENSSIEKIKEEVSEEINKDKEEVKEEVVGRKIRTLEEELQGTISVDVMAGLFEKVAPKKSLNDLLQSTIQIDLNDRIVFVRHLFDGNQNDFNRVISQLNTFKTEKEAKRFINKMIKPDYDWSGKEVHEARLFEIIERRFA